jgi:hypothetical protein
LNKKSASQKYGSNKLAQFGFALLAAFPDSYRELVGEGGFGGGWHRPQAPLAFKQPHIFVKHSNKNGEKQHPVSVA